MDLVKEKYVELRYVCVRLCACIFHHPYHSALVSVAGTITTIRKKISTDVESFDEYLQACHPVSSLFNDSNKLHIREEKEIIFKEAIRAFCEATPT